MGRPKLILASNASDKSHQALYCMCKGQLRTQLWTSPSIRISKTRLRCLLKVEELFSMNMFMALVTSLVLTLMRLFLTYNQSIHNIKHGSGNHQKHTTQLFTIHGLFMIKLYSVVDVEQLDQVLHQMVLPVLGRGGGRGGR